MFPRFLSTIFLTTIPAYSTVTLLTVIFKYNLLLLTMVLHYLFLIFVWLCLDSNTIHICRYLLSVTRCIWSLMQSNYASTETGVTFIFFPLSHDQGLLTMSSAISLIADTSRIQMRGTRVVYRPVGDTPGICCNVSQRKLLNDNYKCTQATYSLQIQLQSVPQGKFGKLALIQHKSLTCIED